MKDNTKTRMTTFKKTKFKISEEIGNLWSRSDLRESTLSDLESPSNFQVKEICFIEIGPEITKLCSY